MKTAYWVLHSAYPGGTWRGVEKCMDLPPPFDGPRLFESEDAARRYAEEIDQVAYWRPVVVYLAHPNVGEACGLEPRAIGD